MYKFVWPLESADQYGMSPRITSPRGRRLNHGDFVFTNSGGLFVVVQVRGRGNAYALHLTCLQHSKH